MQLRKGNCSAAEGLERMSSTMQVDRRKDVVVENNVSLVHCCISVGGTRLRQWVASTSALNALKICLCSVQHRRFDEMKIGETDEVRKIRLKPHRACTATAYCVSKFLWPLFSMFRFSACLHNFWLSLTF